jgi:peptidoglycan/xylan/chitin deacetylase (PgdA/CDA1 family)
MRIFIFFMLFSITSSLFCQKKQVCFTIDDMPVVSYGISDTLYQKKLMNNLISSLKKNNIPAIGFINEKKLFNNDTINKFQVGLFTYWIDNGLEIGNHTYSHPDYNKVSFKEYAADISKGETITKGILNRKNLKLKYFRHPFLHVGNNKLKADSLNRFLSDNGYIVAPVTIDNDDYLFAVAYHRANKKNDKNLMHQIGHDYIEYMEKKVKYFEKQSMKLFGKNINQILLIHASLLNSVYVDSLAAMFRKNDYKFISMDEALKDNVYKTEITKYGNWGISWIDRWAISEGKKGDFFKDEPATPDYIVKMSK